MQRLFKKIAWVYRAYPRTPEKSSSLMWLYYFWDERITPAGHTLAALILFAAFFFFAPGYWALKTFAGVAAILLLVSVFGGRKPKNRVLHVSLPMAEEGETVALSFATEKPLSADETVSVFRVDPSVERLENATLRPRHRGTFRLPKIAIAKLHPLGLSQKLDVFAGTAELLVAPKLFEIQQFRFLTFGKSGAKFERLRHPENSRGIEFVGVREYREGDSLRDLHYKAFARYGRPFTKEFAAESGGGVTLFLDVSATRVREKMCVEFAIRLFGSVAVWLLERNLLGRVFIGNEEVHLDNAKSARERILSALARIPSAKLRTNETLEKWNVCPDTEEPVLSVSVRPLEFATVDKQIVVTCGEMPANADDRIKFVQLDSEISL